MKQKILLIFSFVIFSCSQINEKKDNNVGIIKNDDQKSLIIEKLADSYLQGNFNIAREYFKPAFPFTPLNQLISLYP